MTYEVFVTDKASGQLFEAAQWWAEHRSAEQAKRWFDGFVNAIESLQDNPERCALARENDDLPVTIRELHFGLGSKPTHRAIFVVRPDRVVVYAIPQVHTLALRASIIALSSRKWHGPAKLRTENAGETHRRCRPGLPIP